MDLGQLADDQHGVFARQQALDHGWSTSRLSRWTARGRFERIAPDVYRVVGSSSSWHQRVMIACLSIPGSMASHRCAARLWGLSGFDSAPVEVVTERWRRRHRPLDATVHETKDLVASDIAERHGIPCTSLIRTLVDLPAAAHLFRCGQALDHASRHDDTVLRRVRQRHREVARRGRNGTVAMRTLLLQRGAGEHRVDSTFERRALELISQSALPRPVTQHKVAEGDFVAYIDIAWPQFLVGMECDSYEHHTGHRAHQWDRTRRRTLTALGWDMREFTWEDVVERGKDTIRDLNAALRRAGWQP